VGVANPRKIKIKKIQKDFVVLGYLDVIVINYVLL